jgi:hypothetical protein
MQQQRRWDRESPIALDRESFGWGELLNPKGPSPSGLAPLSLSLLLQLLLPADQA